MTTETTTEVNTNNEVEKEVVDTSTEDKIKKVIIPLINTDIANYRHTRHNRHLSIYTKNSYNISKCYVLFRVL